MPRHPRIALYKIKPVQAARLPIANWATEDSTDNAISCVVHGMCMILMPITDVPCKLTLGAQELCGLIRCVCCMTAMYGNRVLCAQKRCVYSNTGTYEECGRDQGRLYLSGGRPHKKLSCSHYRESLSQSLHPPAALLGSVHSGTVTRPCRVLLP